MRWFLIAGVIIHTGFAHASIKTGLYNVNEILKIIFEILAVIVLCYAGSWVFRGVRAKRDPDRSQIPPDQAWRYILLGLILIGIVLIVAMQITDYGRESELYQLMRIRP